MHTYNPHLKTYARALRINMTEAEQALWFRLRRKQLCNLQVYRQKPVGNFIVDFYCPSARLVVELDGSQHSEDQYRKKDEARDQQLAQAGLRVLRFDNRQVLLEMEAVLAEIERAMKGVG